VDPEEARARFATARVARLATVTANGQPHVIPFTFALLDRDRIVSVVDQKPKRTTALHRLANIAAEPRVAALADHYADDWGELWWVRADGIAAAVDPEADPALWDRGLARLTERYGQYRGQRPPGPLVVIDVQRWSGWAAAIERPSLSHVQNP
jgi:PPOX class probable F420-dependent enzyme